MKGLEAEVAKLAAQRVKLTLKDGKLAMSSPPGWLTPERQRWLAAHKVELIETLKARHPFWWCQERGCAADAYRYRLEGLEQDTATPVCQEHGGRENRQEWP
mgnify:CR=1 FL=1